MIRSTESIGELSCLTSLVVSTYIRSTYITETFTRLSWTPDKVDENELSLIEKLVCAAYGLHNRCRTSDGNRLRFLLFTKLSDKLRKLPPTKEALQLHILRLVHAAGRIWGVILQPSDQIPSLLDWMEVLQRQEDFCRLVPNICC